MSKQFRLSTASTSTACQRCRCVRRAICSSRLAEVQRKSRRAGFRWDCRQHNRLRGPNQPGSISGSAPDVSEPNESSLDAAQASQALASALDRAGCEYALGGAIALGYWAEPRGTLDVDVTLFLPPDKPTSCVRLLQSIDCNVDADRAVQSLSEHNYCQAQFGGCRIDVFLPAVPFYELARHRRKKVLLGKQTITIWDAETLCVFKLMFFRRKDIADLEQILRAQREQLDREWVSQQITAIFGVRDPRVAQWNELLTEM